MTALFNTFFYEPLFNFMVWLTGLTGGHIGIAIIAITIAIRVLLYPFTNSSLQAQQSMKKLQPKINELKKKHGENKEEFSRALMGLYKEHNVNPFSSCLMVLIQLPILWALYKAFSVGLSDSMIPGESLYSFVTAPATVVTTFVGINLTRPSAVMAVIAGFSQYFQARSLPHSAPAAPADGGRDEKMMASMNTQMMYVFPIVTVIVGLQIPAGLSLYWAVSTVLLLAQQWTVFRE